MKNGTEEEAPAKSDYSGKVYRAKSGQWAWKILHVTGEEQAGGAGYESADDAESDCLDNLFDLFDGGQVEVEGADQSASAQGEF